ncbi:MAG: YfcC family protein [Clostridia bacterium]|nr:YfcC family protein [Clostridia bacterium]NCC44589.1 YfcC family protein [Clostridia bacterium]
MIILAVIIILAAVATYVIPAGSFDRVANESTGYDIVDVESYHQVAQNPLKPFNLFVSLTLGLQNAAYVIFFLMIIGGTFKIVESTGALHAGLSNLVYKLKGRELLMIPVCIFIFGLVSATAACCEEYLAFLPLIYVVCVAAGFDSITAVALLFCSAAIGYAGGMTNAFTVGVAQSIAELPMFSGMGMRIGVFAALVVITSIYVFLHARKVKMHPELNEMREIDMKYAEQLDLKTIQPITGRQKIVLAIFALGFVAVAVCVLKLHFYIDEMSGIFIIVALLVGVIARIKPNEFATTFVEGCKDLLWAGLIIGMCNAVTTILSDANVMDTLIYYMGNVLNGLSTRVSACGMFVLQDLLNFLIPSGSGQAAITMPFMAPLSDILGVSRQTAVLAFQMGDAFTNAIAPTSGELMAALAICHVPYKKWVKFLVPLWGLWAIVALVTLVIAVSIGYM